MAGSFLLEAQEHIQTCGTHNLRIDIFCEDCDEFICTKCAKTDHIDHNWDTVATIASLRRRNLFEYLRTIKEGDLSKIDEKIEKASKQIEENKIQCDLEIKKLLKYFDEISTSLEYLKNSHKEKLKENLRTKNTKVDRVKFELEMKRKQLSDTVKYIEENKSKMLDYGFIDNHRELKRLLSDLDVNMKNCEHSMRYKRGGITNDLLRSITGHTIDLDELSATETNSFQYGDDVIFLLEAFNEGDCYVCDAKSDRITTRVNKEGEKTQTFSINPYDMCVGENSDVYFTNYENNSIARLSTTSSFMSLLSYSGTFTTVICTDPL
ncbi:tripartite motif-containing protein 75-like [Saccostrea echinata]|uniref:tripartite motif-containing protein 75-like n=1 Tax=Saccostrea echinata TaxID=191078 RepID=UPI002A8339C0|nr:tripartite motif-containing protein 75-like [Saccostrea echinata]